MRVLAVAANKGGVGKSTLAFQVAAEMARRGLRVLAVDADKQADLTRYARGPRLAGVGLDAVIADPVPRPPSLHRPGWREPGPARQLATARRCRRGSPGHRGRTVLPPAPCLGVVAAGYDWAVIDTGHSEPIIAGAMVAADLLVMPTTASAPDARHAGDMLQIATRVRRELGLETDGLLRALPDHGLAAPAQRDRRRGGDRESPGALRRPGVPGDHPAQLTDLRGQRPASHRPPACRDVREHPRPPAPSGGGGLLHDHRPHPGAGRFRCRPLPAPPCSRRSTSTNRTSPRWPRRSAG